MKSYLSDYYVLQEFSWRRVHKQRVTTQDMYPP